MVLWYNTIVAKRQLGEFFDEVPDGMRGVVQECFDGGMPAWEILGVVEVIEHRTTEPRNNKQLSAIRRLSDFLYDAKLADGTPFKTMTSSIVDDIMRQLIHM
jgi:hypothetical protein